MADFNFQPVASQVKPVPQMSLGDMMNVARGVQQYQQAEQVNPLLLQQGQQATRTGEIALSLEEQKNKERLGAQQFFSNPENFQDETGMIDLKKINESSHLFPLTFPDISQKFSTLAKSQTESNKANRELDTGGRELIASTIAPMGYAGVQDPKEYVKKLIDLKDQYPNDIKLKNAVNAKIALLAQIPGPSPDVAKGAIIASEQLLTPTQGREQFAPKAGTLSTSSRILPTTTYSSMGGQPGQIVVGQNELAKMEIPPGSTQEVTGADVNGIPIVTVKAPNGSVIGSFQVPQGYAGGAAQQGAPQDMPQGAPSVQQPATQTAPQRPAISYNAPARLPAGETPDTYQAAQNIRLAASDLAKQVPIQQFNSNQIIKLADNVISGKGAQTFANLTGGYAGFNALGIGGENATNLQNLGHYMSQQTVALSQGTGLGGTDAGRAIAGDVAGKETWTPQAIKDTARVNRALSTGTELFNRGVQAAFNKTQSPFAARDFQNKWSSTLGNEGIDAIRLYDLTQNKDRDGLKQFVDSLGGPESPKYQAIKSKLGQMSLLLKGQ
jgi:hypothetical protein